MASRQNRINTHLNLVRQDVEDVHDMFYDAFRLTGQVSTVTLLNMLKVGFRRELSVPDAPKKGAMSPASVKVCVATNTDCQAGPANHVEPSQRSSHETSPKLSGNTQGREQIARKLLTDFDQAEESNTEEEANENLQQTPPVDPASIKPAADKVAIKPVSAQVSIKPASNKEATKQYRFSKLNKRGKHTVPVKEGNAIVNIPILHSPVPVKRLRLEKPGTSTPTKPTNRVGKSPVKKEETPPVSPIVASGGDTRSIVLVSSPEQERFAALTEASNKAKKVGRKLNRQFNRNGE